jgi:general secretion pathway protein M
MTLQDLFTRPWLRRMVFVALNVAAILAIHGLLIEPVRSLLADRDGSVADKQALLSRFQSMAAQEANNQELAHNIGAQLAGGEFLAGPNEGVMTADLQTRLKAMAEQAGARLRLQQNLPPRNIGSIRYVGSRLEIFGPLQTIQCAIHAVDTSRPYLFVTAAVVRPSAVAARPGSVEEPVIEARLDIYGATQLEVREP